MRVVIQRVSEASVTVDGVIIGQIGAGLLVFAGIEETDGNEDIEWLCKKIANLRIFNNADNVMNVSAKDVSAQLLVISQFTLHAMTKKGTGRLTSGQQNHKLQYHCTMPFYYG